MSLTLILWFVSTLLALWGASLAVRGLRGERVQLRRRETQAAGEPPRPAHRRPKWRPTPTLILAGLLTCGAGLAMGWWAMRISEELGPRGKGDVTLWHAIAAGIGVFGITLVAWGLFGDRSRGRQRCPRCWYDHTGLTQENLPSTCAECGRSITTARDLHRTRRHRKITTIGAAILLFGGVGLFAMSRPGGPASFVPDRVLVWFAFQGRTASSWVREEITRRIDAENTSISAPLARQWINHTLAGDVEIARIRTPLVSEALSKRPEESRKTHFTEDELRLAWNAHFTHLTDLLINSRPGIQRWVWTYTPSYNTIFMTLEADLDNAVYSDDLRLIPAARLGLPEISEAKREQLSRAFINERYYTRAVAYLFGPESHAVFRDELLQAPTMLAPDGRDFLEASRIALGFSAALHPEAMQDTIDLLASDDNVVRIFGAQALSQAVYLTTNSLSPDQIDAIRNGLDDAEATVRERCLLCLMTLQAVTADDFVRLSLRPDLTDGELVWLFAPPQETLDRLPALDRLTLAENVTRIASPAVRPHMLLDYLARKHAHDPAAIPILRRLTESPATDPFIAEQAQALLDRIELEAADG